MKTNTKNTKSPAPAPKVTAKKIVPAAKVAVAPKSAAKGAPKAVKPAAKSAGKLAVKSTAKAKAKPLSIPVVKPVAPAAIQTSITAEIDIGFGNALYLRGEGAGLSWDRGVLMNCVSDSTWSLELGESSRPIIFKFLVNDLSWSAGEDYSVSPGTSVSVVPTF
jgi:hypothetical protein